jgi:Fuc2NAc and GlcNAc transferase
MGIVVATLAGLAAAGTLHLTSWTNVLAVSASGGIASAIGFADDHAPVGRRVRLLVHFAAAMVALAVLGGMPALYAFGFHIAAGWLLNAVALVSLVWLLNLTNFMDGIDGIAATEAVTVCMSAVVLAACAHASPTTWIPAAIVASAALGFLVWNWPPAKIFMGDAGSGFLGIALGVLALEAARESPQLLWGWIILLGVFVVDATVTLVRRTLRGERVYEPHRMHAYQHAAQSSNSHSAVTLTTAGINLGWLLPISTLVAVKYFDGTIGVVIAYAPLIVAAIAGGAGQPRLAARNGRV